MTYKRNRKMAMALTCTMVAGCVAGCSSTSQVVKEPVEENVPTSTSTSGELADVLDSVTKSNKSELQTNTRKETVYVFDDATGKTNHITVNTKVTDADGVETSTNEESTKEAPVTIDVTYSLNDKEVTPEQLKGQSGAIKIRFDYTNNEETTIQVDGQEQKAYVPFTVVSGMVLDSEKFSNIEVTNGTIQNVGGNLVVIGMAMPGMKETLDLELDGNKTDIDIPSYFEVSADVVDFSLDMTMSVASASLLNSFDLSKVSLDSITDKLDELTDATSQIMDGSGQLAEGTNTLQDAMPELSDGVSELNKGANDLKDGATQVDDGMASLKDGADKLNDGANDLKDGASQIKDGANDLKDGANQIKDGASTLKDGANQIKDGASDLKDGASQVDSGAASLQDGAVQIKDGASDLKDGISSVDTGVATLQDGVGALAAGASSVDTNMETLVSKMNELNKLLQDNGLDTNVTALANGAATLNAGINGENGLLNTLKTNLAAQETNYNQYYAQAYQLIYQAKVSEAVTNYATAHSLPVEAIVSNEAVYGAIGQSVAEGLAQAGIVATPDIASTLANENTNHLVSMSAGLSTAYASFAEAATLCQAAKDATNAALYQSYAQNAMKLLLALNQTNGAYKAIAASYQSVSTSGLGEGMTQLSEGLAALSASIGTFASEKEGTVCTSLLALAAAANQLRTEGTSVLNAGLATLDSSVVTLKDGTSQLLTGATTLADGSATLADGATTLKDGTSALSTGAATLADGTVSLADGAKDLAAGTKDLAAGATTLAEGTSTLADGTVTLANGTKDLVDGANTLKDGTGALADGAKKLAEGTGTLKTSVADLVNGVGELNEGAIKLHDGIVEFNEEGIAKIKNLVKEDGQMFLDTVKEVVSLGQNYTTFTGVEDDKAASVVFIYKTEGITE